MEKYQNTLKGKYIVFVFSKAKNIIWLYWKIEKNWILSWKKTEKTFIYP